MKHSPGNWEPECVGHGGPGDNPVEIWEVTNGHARIAENMTEADARLIAAAPELLAALQTIVAGYQAHFDAMPVAWQTYDNIARAVIAKVNA